MRTAIFAMAATAAILTMSAPAEARGLPFCIKGQGYDDPNGDCRFWTYEQCQATASGRLNFCDTNPFYTGGPPPAPHRHRRHPHRYY